jgi:O-antigen/teichoic acid export membrane protein
LAHLLARLASLAAGVVNIPLVSITLGSEALGLVGIQASLQAILGLIDLGVPTTANRELAVLTGRGASWTDQAAFIRSLEVVLWSLAGLFLLIGLALTGPLTHSWLNLGTLPATDALLALSLIIAGVAVRFPIAFYTNVYFGLGRHIFPNAVVSAATVLRLTASLVALVVVHVGVIGFFALQLVAGAAEVGMLAVGIWWRQEGWRLCPEFRHLRQVARQSTVLMGISISAVGLSQVDKVILSKTLSLADFGVYSAAYALAAGLLAFSYPICNAVFPALSQSFDQHDHQQVDVLTRWASEVTLLLILPVGAAIVAQSDAAVSILFLIKGAPPALTVILPPMVLGGMAQALVTVPHFVQISNNRANVPLYINMVFLPIYVALTYWAAVNWGVIGGVWAFMAFNVARLWVHWGVLVLQGHNIAYWHRLPVVTMALSGLCIAIAYALNAGASSLISRIVILPLTVMLLTALMMFLLPGLRLRLAAALGLRR